MRGLMKTTCFDQSSSLVIKMQTFQDFQDKVLFALEEWDQKALDLSDLSQKYYSELDENRRLFVSLRQVVKDKDNFIATL